MQAIIELLVVSFSIQMSGASAVQPSVVVQQIFKITQARTDERCSLFSGFRV